MKFAVKESLPSGYLFYCIRQDFYFAGIKRLLVGAHNANAPAAIIYSYVKNWDKNRFKGILSGFLLLMASMVIIPHLFLGLTTVSIVITFFKILPFLIAGSVLGHDLFGYIPIHSVKLS
jgi:hypothetical protein